VCFPALGWGGMSPASMSHLSLRASTSIACNRHIPCTTQSALPIGLCVARSSAIGCAVLSEGSYKFGISDTECCTAPTPSAGRRTSQQLRHVLGDDTARSSAQTGVLYLLDASAGRLRTVRNPTSVTLEHPQSPRDVNAVRLLTARIPSSVNALKQ
jgi:hypothetical protein